MGIYVGTASWTISQDGVQPEGFLGPVPKDSDGSFSPLLLVPLGRRATVRGFSVSTDGRQAGGDYLLVRTAVTYLSTWVTEETDPSYDRNSPSTEWNVSSIPHGWGYEWSMWEPPALWQGQISPVAGLIDIQYPEAERLTIQTGACFWLNVLIGTQVEDLHLKATVTYET